MLRNMMEYKLHVLVFPPSFEILEITHLRSSRACKHNFRLQRKSKIFICTLYKNNFENKIYMRIFEIIEKILKIALRVP